MLPPTSPLPLAARTPTDRAYCSPAYLVQRGTSINEVCTERRGWLKYLVILGLKCTNKLISSVKDTWGRIYNFFGHYLWVAPTAVCLQRARCPPCNTINWDVAQAADISSDVEERDREAMLAKVIVNCYLCRHMCVESVTV